MITRPEVVEWSPENAPGVARLGRRRQPGVAAAGSRRVQESKL